MALPGSGGGSGWKSGIAPHVGLLVLLQYVTGLKARYGDRIEVVGVLVRDSLENALVWLEREGTTYPTLQERHGRLAKEFWISGLPRFVLLTPDRRLEWDFLGAASEVNAWSTDSVDVHLEALLAGVR